MNMQKSKLVVSPNTSPNITNTLSQRFEVLITKDLGLYLGLPIIHGRAGAALFEFLLSKVRKKLSGWKMKTLFRAVN